MAEDIDCASLRVLVIDDQEFVRVIVRKMLNQIGIQRVDEAHDGASGLEAVRAAPPDLVICDVQMRPMDGFRFVAELRATPEGAGMPVMMLTAHNDAGLAARAQGLNIDAFLTKPVLPPALRQEIGRVMGAATRKV